MKDIRQKAVSSSILQDPHFVGELQEIFKDIHRHPETGMQEVRTTALIKSIMDGLGVEQIELPGMNVGAACVIRGHNDGPTLALRADMDALPVQEATSLEYKSQNPGLMHACGHDLNTTVMLGVLKYAVRSGLAERMRGNLKFIFQPAEETLNGAKAMIAEGILDNPQVDMILMSHGDPELKTGEIALFRKCSHAASDSFSIEFRGKGGHGSRPHQTQDLILAGAYLVNIFQSIVSRNLDARDAAVLSVCSFNAGTANNILPDTAKLSGTVRTLTQETQAVIQRRMQEACDAMSLLFHMEAILEYRIGVPACRIDEKAEAVLHNAARILPAENIKFSETRMGGEDFAWYAQQVPAGVMRLGVTPPGEDKRGSTHSPTFQADMRAIPVGVSVICQAVEDVLAIRPPHAL